MAQYAVPPDEVLQPQVVDAENWLLLNLMPVMQCNLSTIEFLARRGLLANEKGCAHCRARPMIFQTYVTSADGFAWRCTKCRNRKSVRDGSFFVRSRLPLKTILLIIYFWAEDVPQKFAMRELQIDKKTCIDWYNFIRCVCSHYLLLHPISLGGLDKNGYPMEVEIDESCYFHRKHNKCNANPDRKWMFGAYERRTQRTMLVEVRDRTCATLQGVIEDLILPGTRILSDVWAAYGHLDMIHDGVYMHEFAGHSDNFAYPLHPDIHTRNVEGMWAVSKRRLRHQDGAQNSLFPTYLSQFNWENEMKAQRKSKFNAIVNCIREVYPV